MGAEGVKAKARSVCVEHHVTTRSWFLPVRGYTLYYRERKEELTAQEAVGAHQRILSLFAIPNSASSVFGCPYIGLHKACMGVRADGLRCREI